MHLSNRELFKQYLAVPSELKDPIEIVKSKGIYIYDSAGKEYIDLVSGVSVSNVGHLNKHVVSAIKEQLDNYMHLMVYGKYIQSPQVRLAKILSDNLPDTLNSVYLVNSGSEAVEGALKLAKRITGRSKIIAFNDAYHGSTHGALSILGNEEMKRAFRPLLPGIIMSTFNSDEAIDLITSEVAAIIMEPIQTEAGIILPKADWLNKIRERCDETGTMLIFDEVQLGIGRTGRFMAFENFNVVPDILCLAKALGSGMPVGAFISSDTNMSKLTYNPELGHITTFGGHPVSCAAAIAGLEVIFNQNLLNRANTAGRLFHDLLSNSPGIKEIRRVGLMIGVEVDDSISVPKLLSVFNENGLIVDQFLFNDRSFRIAPPLIITDTEIHKIVEKIIQSLDQIN